MAFDPFFNTKIMRGDRISRLASDLGFDDDDMASGEDMTQQVIAAREYLRASQEKASQTANNWAVDSKPLPIGDVQYRKTGLDEYRITYRGNKGVNSDELDRYPPLNSVKSATELFAELPFALQQLPVMFEDDNGNIWSMETKQT